MKSIFTFFVILFFTTSAFAQSQVAVITGEGYANEVYYNFENEILKTVPRANWDIAFVGTQMSVSVLANNGAGVMLYTWPKGAAADWASVDTTGMNWIPMYNSIEDWDYGAFNANTIPGDQFDYGWGKYSMITHKIVGDSIFIMKLPDDSYKKFIVKEKNAIQNVWTFQYADLDGQNDTTITLDAKQHQGTSFIQYSIGKNEVVEHEPTERWDLLFTRYFDYNIPYYVTGVLSNSGIKIQQVNGVSQPDFKDYDPVLFNDTISEIGSDWKSFSMASFTYVVDTSVVYFIQDTTGTDNAIWKLYFTDFSGSATGIYTFVKEKMNTTSVQSVTESNVVVYPNPASNEINIIHDFKGDTEFTVYNIAGQPVLKTRNFEGSGLNKQRLNISDLPVGMYTVRINSGNDIKTVKFLKR